MVVTVVLVMEKEKVVKGEGGCIGGEAKGGFVIFFLYFSLLNHFLFYTLKVWVNNIIVLSLLSASYCISTSFNPEYYLFILHGTVRVVLVVLLVVVVVMMI